MGSKARTSEFSDKVVSEIRLFSDIAQANGSNISLQDISTLTSTSLTERELENAWAANPFLSAVYELRQDLVLERRDETRKRPVRIFEEEAEKRARARKYIVFAREFLSYCTGKAARLLSISGSTSYLSPSPGDDLDFFAIAEQDSLWIFLAKSLLLARAYRYLHPDSPRICFSYAIDEAFAEKHFAAPRDPLSARDALKAIVVQGPDFYTRLLRKNTWISDYYPKLYQQKTKNAELDPAQKERSSTSTSRKFLNLFLFYTVGKYIRVKSALLNRALRTRGETASAFNVKIGRDHLVFESARYTSLRRMYNKLQSIRSWKQPASSWEGER